jgi:hypothetical protein
MPLVPEIELAQALENLNEIAGFAEPPPDLEAQEVILPKFTDKPLNVVIEYMNGQGQKILDSLFVGISEDGYILSKDGVIKKKDAPPVYRIVALCCHCKSPILEDGVTGYFRKGDLGKSGLREDYFCCNCVKQHKSCCQCSLYFSLDSLRFDTCPQCVERAPDLLIKSYGTKAERAFPKLGKSLDKVYFGVEQEFESTNYGLDTLIVHNLIKSYAILKRDSSINQGFEVVSAPATLDVHQTIWDEFFAQLPATVDVVNIKGENTCGMHVHVSRVRMTDLQIGKILKFTHNPANKDFITMIAGRPSSYHNDFAKPKAWRDGINGGRSQSDADRHTAVNCNGGATLEFRIFRATKDKSVFLKNIEYCYALTRFAQSANFSIADSCKHGSFISYVEMFRKDFPNLYNFIRQNYKIAS